jgi:phosphomethylpyrimidine synthase
MSMPPRSGEITSDYAGAIAENEGISKEKLVQKVARGTVVIFRSQARDKGRPLGVGESLRTKVNANIGTSLDLCDVNLEVEKAKAAVAAGADTVMDLSTAGDLDEIRRKILSAIQVPLGTVPIYQAALESVRKNKTIVDMGEEELFKVIEKHAKDGVDFMTVHCGVTKDIVDRLAKKPRVTGIVSRGGTFHAAWMIHNQKENPLYANYDHLLDLAKRYGFALSLGDGLRPGCIADATDEYQIRELLNIGGLVERARKAGVQALVEGPGHIPLDQVEANVRLAKAVTQQAPLYILGPVVTDIAPGYDHIVGSIGGAIAGMAGADFLCYLTESEHLALPTLEEVREGVYVTRIAAHVADIARIGRSAAAQDLKMAQARAALNWKDQLKLAINRDKARMIHERVKSESGACSMCSDWCVFKILDKYMKERPPEKCF